MPDRIRMPDTITYWTVILILYGPSAPTLAAILWRRSVGVVRIRYAYIYLGVLLSVCIWGSLFLDIRPLLGTASGLVAALPAGLAAGHLAIAADQGIVRLLGARSRSPPRGSARPRASDPTSDSGFTLWSLISAAILEEILFRGWYVQASLLIESSHVRWVAISVSVLAFALLHLNFGWHQVIAKLPLSALALSTGLLTGSTLAPIFTHAYFNWHYWRKMKH